VTHQVTHLAIRQALVRLLLARCRCFWTSDAVSTNDINDINVGQVLFELATGTERFF
jgi:hypothetical protein